MNAIPFFLFAALPLIPVPCDAGVLSLEPGAKVIENVPVWKGASASVEGRSFELTTVGAGLRSKKVAIVNVKVYVAQLLVSDPAHYVRTSNGALDSVNAMNEAALRLDFLRTVDAQSVQSAFKDSLLANEVDLNSPAIESFLQAVSHGGDALQGKALTLVIEHLSNGTETVTYEDTNGKASTIAGPQGFARAILSIWLGKPSDNGVANLKKALIQGL